MKVHGLELSGHKLNIGAEFDFPPVVPGRVLHIDADFLAYQVSADEAKTFEQMCHNHDERVEKLTALAGAEKHVLHLTPKESDKGYRFDVAIQKEYQGHRKNKPKPTFLHAIRKWMAEERDAVLYIDREADDGMSAAAYSAYNAGESNKCVIATKDKDLLMCPGLLLDWDTGEISSIDDTFGFLSLSGDKQKKLRGRGTLMFWAQMLMGDPADNIQGLPKVHFKNKKPKACGPVLAHSILSRLKNDRECFSVVRDLYKKHGEKEGYFHWKTGEPVPWGEVFRSEARLLWMRRNENLDDALHWIDEILTYGT